MSRRRLFLIASAVLWVPLFFILGSSIGGCGRDESLEPELVVSSTPPTVSALRDESGESIELSGSITSISTNLTVTFSESMDANSPSTSNLTLIDANGNAITGSIVAATDTDQIIDNEFTFTPSTQMTQLSTHTFRVTGGEEGVKDTTGDALEEDTTYAFTTRCSSSDDFSNSDSLDACFSFMNTTNHTNTVNLSEAAAISVVDGALKLDMTSYVAPGEQNDSGEMPMPMIYKKVEGDFDVQITINSLDFAVDFPTVDLSIMNPEAEEGEETMRNSMNCGMDSSYTFATSPMIDGASTIIPAPGNCVVGGGDTAILRIVRSGSTFQCLTKCHNEDFTQLGPDAVITALPETVLIGIMATNMSDAGTDEHFFDNLIFNSGAAVGQE